ncbi:MAG: hypothetical protein K2N56_03130 [Oscillospiraceae bacterium]|nr:hypothetical protein [Oscillospiraceae bacterium]
MAIAKIITERNTQKVILPEGFHFDCSEVEVQRNGTGIILIPKSGTEKYETLPDEEITRISDELMKENAVAYRELAKW